MLGKAKHILIASAVAAAIVAAGCGGDDDEGLLASTTTAGATGTTGASGATGASGEDGAGATPIDLAEARTNLEEAGFTVEDQAGDDLAQEAGDETINAAEGIRVFEPGDPADVVIQQFESPEDAEAVADSLSVGFFAVETRDDVVLFAVKDQEALLDEVATAAGGE